MSKKKKGLTAKELLDLELVKEVERQAREKASHSAIFEKKQNSNHERN